MIDLGQRLEQFRHRCREAGVRMTPQRMEIFCELAGVTDHPCVETLRERLRERLPHVSPDTIYRTLARFVSLGLAQQVGVVGGSARFDANAATHPHFFCRICGAVHDIPAGEGDTPNLPDAAETIGAVEQVRLQVWGVCRACTDRDIIPERNRNLC